MLRYTKRRDTCLDEDSWAVELTCSSLRMQSKRHINHSIGDGFVYRLHPILVSASEEA